MKVLKRYTILQEALKALKVIKAQQDFKVKQDI
jgi:hypothetical protein